MYRALCEWNQSAVELAISPVMLTKIAQHESSYPRHRPYAILA